MTDNEESVEKKRRRYLLGHCSEQESGEIEEAIVTDDNALELMAVAEDELTEDYVNGDLDEADRASFELRYLNKEEARRKTWLSAFLRNRFDVAGKLTTLASFDFRDRPAFLNFIAYFDELLQIKMSTRTGEIQASEDIRQETFVRFFSALRDGKISRSEHLGSFLNSICNNVMLEYSRASSTTSAPMSLGGRITAEQNVPGPVIDLLRSVEAQEMNKKIRETLSEMAERDRRLLQEVFLKNRDREEVCKEFGVDPEYLLMLLNRAKLSVKHLFAPRSLRRVGTERPGRSRGRPTS